jgi:N-acyl-D-aspartate/D-glutamate deacylase
MRPGSRHPDLWQIIADSLASAVSNHLLWGKMDLLCRVAAVAAMCLTSVVGAQEKAVPFDVIIENGHVMDGTGSPWFAADVGIRNGRIAAIGRLAGLPSRQRIDAHGNVVAPGFIDMLGQSELTVLVNPHLPSKIFQGITTEITGEGGSVAPLNADIIAADHVGYEHLRSPPTGARSANISHVLKNRALGSTSRHMSAQQQSGEWCLVMPIASQAPPTSTK